MSDASPNLAANASLAWSTRAEDALRKFLEHRRATRALDSFMTEDVREWVERHGFPAPPEPRAWGALMLKAKKARRIEPAGFAESNNPQAHRRPTALWRLVL